MKKTILYISLGFVAFLYGQTQLNWNTQIRNRPNITRTGANATWTDNVTFSGGNTFNTGTNTFNSPIVSCQQNGILTVGGAITCWSGADIGAQINTAYATLPTTGGTIQILPQTGGSCYNFTTPIVFATVGKYVLLQGLGPTSVSSGGTPSGGVCLNYTPITATTAMTFDYTPSGGGAYLPGSGIRDLTLTNNACVTNGGCGSSAIGLKTGGTNGGAHKAEFANTRISGFGTGVTLNDTGGIGWGIVFRNFSLTWNTTGFTYTTYHENIAWYGGVCAVNTTCMSDATGSNLNAHGISLDSNVTVGITGNNTFSCTGCWIENLNQPNFQIATVTGGVFTIFATNIVDDNNSGTLTQLITATSGETNVDASIFSAGQTITNIFNNSGGGTGDITWSSSSPTLIASACATPSFCFFKQRNVPGQPPRLSIVNLALPPDTVGVGGLTSQTVCRHNAAQNYMECSYNNDAFAKMAKVNQAHTWSALQTFNGQITTNQINSTNLTLSSTAPTISGHFNTSGDSITANGTVSFAITTGTGTATSTGTLTLPTAIVGWNCWLTDQTRATHIQQTGGTTTTAIFTNYGTTFAATNWSNGDFLRGGCVGY